MGDTGSQFIDMFLAYFSIKILWNNGVAEANYSIFLNFTLVVLVFAIPLIDTTIVSVNRLLRGQSPIKGGKDHTTHHLVYKGFTEKQVTYIFILLSIVSVIFAFMVKTYIPKESLFIYVIWSYLIVVFVLLFKLSRKQEGIIIKNKESLIAKDKENKPIEQE